MINNYKVLNTSFKKKLIFNFGYEAGFYSELNNMILAIIYCLEHKIEFRIYSKDAKFTTNEGWNDFFIPFCEESTNIFHKYFNRRIHPANKNIKFLLLKKIALVTYRFFVPNTYLTNDLWQEFHNKKMEERRYTFPTLGVFNDDLQTTSKAIVNIVYRFNFKTKGQIDNLLDSINLPDQYVGFHIRRGDKILEINEFPNSLYIRKSIQICNSIRSAFVLTDDYKVIKDLKDMFSDWNFYTLTNPNEKGYEFSEYVSKPVDDKRKDMIKLFASMEIIRKSNFFIGTYSSNPGMFLGMCMEKEKTFGVDLAKWQIW